METFGRMLHCKNNDVILLSLIMVGDEVSNLKKICTALKIYQKNFVIDELTTLPGPKEVHRQVYAFLYWPLHIFSFSSSYTIAPEWFFS